MRFGNSNPLTNIPLVVKNLLIINVIVFFAQNALPNIGFNFTEYFSRFYWRSELFYPHQLLSGMFLHSDFFHLLSNMIGLYIFGRVLEDIMGSKRFLTFYVISGIGAGLISILSKEVQFQYLASKISPDLIEEVLNNGINLYNQGLGYIDETAQQMNNVINTPSLGASGPIFGILLAFGYLFPNAQLMLLFPPIPIKGKYIATFSILIGIYLDLLSPGNSGHFAHIGGVITAFILLKVWKVKSNSFRI